jgi:lipoprotein-anchoring transpeptidase ErfK/SrfK
MRRALSALRPLLAGPALVLALATGACGVAGTPAPGPGNSPPVTTISPRPSASQATSPPGTVSPPATSRPSPRTLTLGMRGADVRQLQARLAELHYHPGTADGRFGQDTLEALWAFQAVNGMTVTGVAGAATWQALAQPRQPGVLVPEGGGLRVEIDLSRQVLVLYRSGQVALISHISSGGGYYYCSPSGCGYAVTPTGDFKTTVFMPGWVTVPLGEMYNPVFFIGTSYAIHGSESVPLQPASHGCVRIPMIIAEFLHKLVPVPGTPVYIRR